ncbi:hypothetical protein SPRG_12235 [Saprolegnia parasitica CBS 223.65]|uniref:WW domain-containing protein n=1 Tax=Saprolegnia parasitica (strain CBS 223.65) TaxID=695850 RepID=A0A067C638_SAPPC|nr:hypothetical protein SPRG_12235 [Saprolegnia parasitica CBS 223.65]KDO22026.1 hypothetical protein SPRG_12235 [Saprolegnia parasitica CBS 223.65]|eukprot:XP_012207269.1 hypothetical protein SPRG_12235 [Saprolegnia parasitica CBS 223.65]
MGRTWGKWSEHDAGDGWKYYHDAEANESMWEMPIEVREELGEMDDMMKTALAFSGEWGVFDAGFGTLYYFHLPSRTSVWERPDEWGSAPEMSYAQLAILRENEAAAERAAADAVRRKERFAPPKAPAKDPPPAPVVATAPPPQDETDEEKKLHMERIEAFRAMLREKGILPHFKWDGALPRIAIDDRFRAIADMDERRAIFEHFLKHRKAEIATEMKRNVKKARKAWASFVEATLLAMPLSQMSKKKASFEQFLATLQDNESFEAMTTTVLNVLPLAVQESVYQKQLDAWYPKAMHRRLEYKRLLDLWSDHKKAVADAEEYTDPAITKLRTQVEVTLLSAIDEEEIFATCQENFRKEEDERAAREAAFKQDAADRLERQAAAREEAAREAAARRSPSPPPVAIAPQPPVAIATRSSLFGVAGSPVRVARGSSLVVTRPSAQQSTAQPVAVGGPSSPASVVLAFIVPGPKEACAPLTSTL